MTNLTKTNLGVRDCTSQKSLDITGMNPEGFIAVLNWSLPLLKLRSANWSITIEHWIRGIIPEPFSISCWGLCKIPRLKKLISLGTGSGYWLHSVKHCCHFPAPWIYLSCLLCSCNCTLKPVKSSTIHPILIHPTLWNTSLWGSKSMSSLLTFPRPFQLELGQCSHRNLRPYRRTWMVKNTGMSSRSWVGSTELSQLHRSGGAAEVLQLLMQWAANCNSLKPPTF